MLLDDRVGVSPGIKFNDAELIGVPTIVVVGRGLVDGVVEVKDRRSGDRRDVTIDKAVVRAAHRASRLDRVQLTSRHMGADVTLDPGVPASESSTDDMDVLVIESAPGIAATLEHRLVRDGHEVISCNDSHGGPCAGVESNANVPAAATHRVAVLARERGAARRLNEMGAVCALRHRGPAGDAVSG